MSVQKFLSAKSIQSLMVSGLVITGLIGFSSSAAISQEQNTQEFTKTQTLQNTSNPVKESTRSKWGCFYRPC